MPGQSKEKESVKPQILSEQLTVRMSLDKRNGECVRFRNRNWLVNHYENGVATLTIYHAEEIMPRKRNK